MIALDPRLALAFDAYRTRLWRTIAARVVSVAVLLSLALYVRHWGTWVLFGVVAFMQTGGALALLYVSRLPGRFRARLLANPTELVWLHTAPEPRTKFHRVELHDRTGDLTVLFGSAGIAAGAAEAARAMAHAPTITTSADERAAAEPRFRIMGKLAKLEAVALETVAPRLAAQRDVALEAIAAWRAHLGRPGDSPYRAAVGAAASASPLDVTLTPADLEARLDRLLHLYASARLSEGHRVKIDALTKEKNLPTDLIRSELFTEEIATLLADLDSRAPR